jgi:hypothetical protein
MDWSIIFDGPVGSMICDFDDKCDWCIKPFISLKNGVAINKKCTDEMSICSKHCEIKLSELSETLKKMDYKIPFGSNFDYWYRTKKICEDAVMFNYMNIQFVPDKFKDWEMVRVTMESWAEDCLFHSKKHPLDYIPSKYIFKCIEYMFDYEGDYAIFLVPSGYKTPEVWKLAFDRGCLLGDIDPEFLTKEMVQTRLETDTSEIDIIPVHLLTQELCNEYIKKGGVMRKVPPVFRTYDLYIIALKHISAIKKFDEIPNEFRTQEVYLLALENGHIKLEDIPEQFRA